ncbi:LAETG motif-containing sortase-dependent surface protein [Streptomyces broussonetiae]|uniref:LAETG motif-containing sortase-dependent surface protein n=1 Tax=Streptomyces broussonetiae TaxID=2686304 RepID=A0ABV5EG83_9ACTN
MKLRRAIAVAAATAAIAPMALLAAPAAYADGESSSTPTASVSVTESASDDASDSASPSATESAPDTSTSESSDETDSESTAAPTPSDSASQSVTATPTESVTGTASPTASASESPGTEQPDFCADPEGSAGLSTDLRSGLSGLPETIVAGSGWTSFSFSVSNKSDDEIKDIVPLIGVAAIGWEDETDYSGQIRVQVLDKATGSWNTLAGAAGEGAAFPAFSLDAGKSTSFQLRLSVSGKVPDAIGLTGGLAQYSDDEGCWIADDPNGWIYFFDILAAGSDAGNPNDSKPQGGMGDLDEVGRVQATGSLAETGSSSALPLIGLVGGAAVVAGAGAVFAVRRRKAVGA